MLQFRNQDLRLGRLLSKDLEFLVILDEKEWRKAPIWIWYVCLSVGLEKANSAAHCIDHLHRVLLSKSSAPFSEKQSNNGKVSLYHCPSAVLLGDMLRVLGLSWYNLTVFKCLEVSWGRQITSCPALSWKLTELNLYFHFWIITGIMVNTHCRSTDTYLFLRMLVQITKCFQICSSYSSTSVNHIIWR